MSNLPPGVRECDIPGNRPEDGEREAMEEWAIQELIDSDLTVDECSRAIKIGIAAIKAEREDVKNLVNDAIADYERYSPSD